jgi:hypothetical protein
MSETGIAAPTLKLAKWVAQFGNEDSRVHWFLKEPTIRWQTPTNWISTTRYDKDSHRWAFTACTPGKVIAVQCARHFHVCNDGIDIGVANMRRPFVGAASLQYLKARLPQGIGGEEADCCVVVYDKYPRTMVVLSAHAGRHCGQKRVSAWGYYYSPFLGSLIQAADLNRI